MKETIEELLNNIGLSKNDQRLDSLELLDKTSSRYIRDLKVNVGNVLNSNYLSVKETALLSVSIAANNKNDLLKNGFIQLAKSNGANDEEISESIACASLLASNNVLYRFRHFLNKDSYNKFPGKIKMNIMMKPVLGKEFFELMSLVISAINGCEMCVNAHESSVLKLESREERIWDAIRLGSVMTSLDKIVH